MKSESVTSLNNKIKSSLEITFISIYINGEISNLVNHSSGHSYFVIKDKYSCIKCVLFKGNKHKVSMTLEDGAKVEIKGALTVYSPRGEYQVICSNIELFGQGDLYAKHEALKIELRAKGYFDESKKKTIDTFIDNIVVITSKSGAVIQDILNVAKKRWPLVKIHLIDTLVQGANASLHIVESIHLAHSYHPDVIVLARGGGSIEDLWAFNEQIVADAIYQATIPIISAIGHESDFLISDLVADLRAPTPSASMEILLPDINEYIQYIDDLKSQMTKAMTKVFIYKERQIKQLKDNTKSFVLQNQFDYIQKDILIMKNTFKGRLEHILYTKEQELPNIKHLYVNIIQTKFKTIQQSIDTYKKLLGQYNPQSKATLGKAKVLRNNKLISLNDIVIDDIFSLEDNKCTLQAKAISKNELFV
jgi:exodeoxyribonuclease VII large subunit